MAINIAGLAVKLRTKLLTVLDSLTASEKLQRVTKALNSSNPEAATEMVEQLSTREQLEKLFAEEDALKAILPTLNGCCFSVNQSLKRVLNKAIEEKSFATDLDSDFAKAASHLQSMLCQELCASYGN